MVKKILVFVFIISLFFILTGCGKTPKEDVFSIVEKNYDEILKACEEKDADTLLAINGITKVNIVDGYVIIFCEAKGISVSSQDYGFYYSEKNSPVTIDCNQDIVCGVNDLTPEGSGYQCVVQGNTFYTEHIKGNIYFYSNAY
ncbi:MAG: hypothetical protein IJC85_05865 [Oscillospiraceae bacterium]|nr:hypothetical protein [Oscillospiraceae bacterium]